MAIPNWPRYGYQCVSDIYLSVTVSTTGGAKPCQMICPIGDMVVRIQYFHGRLATISMKVSLSLGIVFPAAHAIC